MKKFINILIIIVVFGAGYYLITNNENPRSTQNTQKVTYNKSDVGLKFEYPTGPSGYVLDERMPVDLGTGLVRVVILTRSEDALQHAPVGGEFPPVITIAIFENPKKQSSRVWADENTQYSNINLAQGEITETVVGGANAISYFADGLYASENRVVAHGENVYVITGQFIEENSPIHQDFVSILNSITFIPKPGQE